MQKVVLLILLLFALSKLNAHPVHISVINMDITEDGRIIFSVKLFTDDFENVINTKSNITLTFTKETELSAIEEYVTNYISNNFIIRTKLINLESEYNLTKMEMDSESVWFYFEIENKNYNFDELIIENKMMLDVFQDQTNLFIISIKGKEEAYSFNNKNRKKSFIR